MAITLDKDQITQFAAHERARTSRRLIKRIRSNIRT